jgi:hypothetical protein
METKEDFQEVERIYQELEQMLWAYEGLHDLVNDSNDPAVQGLEALLQVLNARLRMAVEDLNPVVGQTLLRVAEHSPEILGLKQPPRLPSAPASSAPEGDVA